MAGRSVKDYIRSAFQPLTEAADLPALLEKLTTADLPAERRKHQFDKIKSFSFDMSDVVYLPNGGFLSLFSNMDGRYIGLSSSGLNSQEEADIENWAESRGLETDEMDESTFLRLSYDLKGYVRLSDEARSRSGARDAIDIINDNYRGHGFSDLYRLYQRVFLVKIPADSSFYNASVFDVAVDLCCANQRLRSQIVDDEVSALVRQAASLNSIINENLFLAVTSAQWRHFFLEVYRCVEPMFFLPWILELRDASAIGMRAVDLKAQCRTSLRWREKEEPSIEKLFDLIIRDASLDAIEDKVPLFKQHKNSDEFKQSTLGRQIYKIRNSLVHHEDYDDPAPLIIETSEWRNLSIYLLLVVVKLHTQFERDLRPVAA